MKKKSNAWPVSLVVFVIWIIIVLGGEMLAVGGNPTGLDAQVNSRIVPALVIAPIFLLLVIAYFKWWRETGLKWVDDNRSLLLLWLPALGIIFMLAIGLPVISKGGQVLFFVLINSLLVGISEELMFRGILLHSASTRYRLWAAIWIVSILFGLIHSLNGFVTGDFGPAFLQAGMAFLTGVMFIGLRLRQASVLPVMLVHGLWDFSVFTAIGTTLAVVGTVFPILFFIYGLWLLRDYRHQETAVAAS